jgi:YVTN family beta-propeller protein
VTPDGRKVFTTNSNTGSVSVITVATGAVTTIFGAGDQPYAVAFTPDGKTAYVGHYNNGDPVRVIDVATNTIVTTVPAGDRPQGIAIAGPVQIGNAGLHQAPMGNSYSQQLWSVSGTAPFTYAVTNGALPPGLTLSPSGLISGTPSTTTGATFTVAVYDSSTNQQVGVKAFTLSTSTAVGYAGGRARFVRGHGVRIRWSAGRGADIVGFDVFRLTRHGRKRLNHRLLNGTVLGRDRFTFTDRAGRRGSRYVIRALLTNGRHKVYGPYRAG